MSEIALAALALSNVALVVVLVMSARGEAKRVMDLAEKAFAYLKPESAKVDESIRQHKEVFELEKAAYAKELRTKPKTPEKKPEAQIIVDQDTGHKIEVLDIM
jgi:hypothetical protein